MSRAWIVAVARAATACVVSTGAPAADAPVAGDAAKGRIAFRACAACHQVGPSARNGFGPPLNGLIDRRAGTSAGYDYSPAMRSSAVVWTPESLAAFIRDANRVVPGTKMRFSSFGYGDGDVRNLVAYLASLPPVAPSSAR